MTAPRLVWACTVQTASSVPPDTGKSGAWKSSVSARASALHAEDGYSIHGEDGKNSRAAA